MTDDLDPEMQLMANDPRQIGYWFFTALHDRVQNMDDLQLLVTPESRQSWGSFEIAAALMDSIDDPGMVQEAVYAHGDLDVCYMRVVRGVTEHKVITSATRLDDPLLVTLVWRPDHGRWMVHQFGDAARPETVPRGA